ncbi:MAG: hypothetical protein KA187_05310 [Arenimonas sp.]|nr:hypothetical protein [Arenimonas sp.]MBP6626815.1 hypothetical protein [Arenimonas sp.]
MRRLLITSLFLFTLASGTVLAQQFSSLEERMSEAEFKAAGLDKLSPEELTALNSWLSTRVGGGAALAAGADTRGFQEQRSDGVIVSRITGEFRGWDGRGDRITLDNGQVWEVVDSTSRLKVKVQDPTVTIEPGILSSWELRISGYNTRAKVRRVK